MELGDTTEETKATGWVAGVSEPEGDVEPEGAVEPEGDVEPEGAAAGFLAQD